MSKLVVIFPGIGYTADKPLLYYGLNVANEAGYREVRKIRFSGIERPADRSDATMREVFLKHYAQVKEQLSDIDWDAYDDVLFISKSIGTIAASAYAKEFHLDRVRQVLYTPLMKTFEHQVKNATAFIGTADGWSDWREIVRLSEENGVPVEVYEGCNHSLETADVQENLQRMMDIMEKTKRFLSDRDNGDKC